MAWHNILLVVLDFVICFVAFQIFGFIKLTYIRLYDIIKPNLKMTLLANVHVFFRWLDIETLV